MFLELLGRKWALPVIIIALIICQFVFIDTNSVWAAAPAKETSIQGTIRISGDWALYPVMAKWAEEFKI